MFESIATFVDTYQVAIARTVILLTVFGALQISAAVLVYFERKIAAWTQQRLGPNRVGPVGSLQPLADEQGVTVDRRVDNENARHLVRGPDRPRQKNCRRNAAASSEMPTILFVACR